MTVLHFLRHGDHDWLGRGIAGRLPGVHLNADGQKQVEKMADRVAKLPLVAIFSSPLERALETAGPIAERSKLQVQISEDIQEIDFGDWTGVDLDTLHHLEQWQRWNYFRSGTHIPHGECMMDVQTRIACFLMRTRDRYPDAHVAVCSHGDPIKSAVSFCVGAPLDQLFRIEIGPASISTVVFDHHGPQLIRMNDTAHLES